MTIQDKFGDDYVDERTITLAESGCWIWMLSTVKGGYGKAYDGSKTYMAHRAIWEARNGPIPEGMLLCHRCDIASCVNPDHMFLGTSSDNSADMVKKGRSARGEKIGNAKLTPDLVSRIRKSSKTDQATAHEFGVSKTSIWHVRNNVTWRHVI